MSDLEYCEQQVDFLAHELSRIDDIISICSRIDKESSRDILVKLWELLEDKLDYIGNEIDAL